MNLEQELEKASRSKWRLWLLNRIMWNIVPFNKPHKLQITGITNDSITISLPYGKKNFNHIKGIHACALATLSEYITGISLLRALNPKEYRLIMKSLKMEYFYQAKQDVIATFELKKEEFCKKLKAGLEKDDFVIVPLSIDVFDTEKNLISNGKVEWQIKPWNKVKTKV